AGVGISTILENEDIYAHRIVRNETTGRIEWVDGREVNISRRGAAGADIVIEGFWSTTVGEFYPSFAATYTYLFDQQLASTAPVASNLAKYNAAGWAPRWKIVPRLGWSYKDKVRAMLIGRYVSSYDD